MHALASVAHGPHRRVPHRPPALLLGVTLGAIATVALVGGVRAVSEIRAAYAVTSPAPPPAVDPVASLTNSEPIAVTTTTADWKKVRIETTVDRVLHDRSLWRQMHFEDWDRVPRAIREEALNLMVRVYADVIRRPASWRGMTARNWLVDAGLAVACGSAPRQVRHGEVLT